MGLSETTVAPPRRTTGKFLAVTYRCNGSVDSARERHGLPLWRLRSGP
jgi:hypothetical protein